MRGAEPAAMAQQGESVKAISAPGPNPYALSFVTSMICRPSTTRVTAHNPMGTTLDRYSSTCELATSNLRVGCNSSATSIGTGDGPIRATIRGSRLARTPACLVQVHPRPPPEFEVVPPP